MIFDIKIYLLSKAKFVQIFKLLFLIPIFIYSYNGEIITFSVNEVRNIDKVLSDNLSSDINPTAYFQLENISLQNKLVEYRKYYFRNYLDTLIIKSTKPLSMNFLNNIKKPFLILPVDNTFLKRSRRIHQRYEFLNRPLTRNLVKLVRINSVVLCT